MNIYLQSLVSQRPHGTLLALGSLGPLVSGQPGQPDLPAFSGNQIIHAEEDTRGALLALATLHPGWAGAAGQTGEPGISGFSPLALQPSRTCEAREAPRTRVAVTSADAFFSLSSGLA